MKSIYLIFTLLFSFSPQIFAFIQNEPAVVCREALSGPVSAQEIQAYINSKKSIVIGSYNILNLYMSTGKFSYNDQGQFSMMMNKPGKEKPPKEREGIAKVIQRMNPDFLALQEIEGDEAIHLFNERHLNNEYKVFTEKGNDSRGIQTAFLVKKEILKYFNFKFRSFKNETWVDPTDPEAGEANVFSRDLLALEIYAKSDSDMKVPLFVLLGNHLKSKRFRPGDEGSFRKRKAQVEKTVEVYRRYKKVYGDDLPVLEMGDHNANVNYEPEFEAFNQVHWVNAMDYSSIDTDFPSRVTHTYHPQNERSHYGELDAIFIPDWMSDGVVQAEVYDYLDDKGQPLPFARTYAERKRQPSDHRAISAELSLDVLLKRFKVK